MAGRFILLCLIANILLAGRAVADRPMIILATPQAPFKYERDGAPAGIDVDVISHVLAAIDQPYRVRFIRSDTRIQVEARAGRADILLVFSKKAERMAYLEYPEESYIDITWNFFIRKEDRNRIRFDRLEDLQGLRVGATRDVAYTPEFWAAGLDLQVITNNDLQIRKLIGGRIDVVALNTINTLYEQKSNGLLDKVTYLAKPLKSKPYFNVFARNSRHPAMATLKRRYDAIIRSLKRDGTIKKIYDRHLGGGFQHGS